MKLKTLKDLQKNCLHPDGSKIRAEELKKEAIKWVQEKDKYWYQNFKKFFNITSEDLK